MANGRHEKGEKVQEKALKITSGLKEESYEERCKKAGLEALDERRKLQDMTQEVKILKGIDKLDPEMIFPARRQHQHNGM
jgi:hypothetical protein